LEQNPQASELQEKIEVQEAVVRGLRLERVDSDFVADLLGRHTEQLAQLRKELKDLEAPGELSWGHGLQKEYWHQRQG
jgi:hypothetical protein